VITGRAVPRTGTAVEKQSGFLLRFPGQEPVCENFPFFPGRKKVMRISGLSRDRS
jgi:hypothetical protein